MKDRMGAYEKIHVVKRRVIPVEFRATLAGRVGIRRFERLEGGRFGRFIGEGYKENTINAAGKDLFLNLISGNSADHMGSTCNLVIKNSSDVTQKTFTDADTNWPKDSDAAEVASGEVDFQFSDVSVDTYAADRAYLESPAAVVFAQNTATGWGNKPADENWIYLWTLSISGGAAFVAAGLDWMMRLMIGTEVGDFDGTNTRALLYNGSRVLQHTKVADSAPTVDTGADTLYWEFTFSDGNGDGDWGTFEMDVDNNAGTVVLRSSGTGTTGVKSTGDVWTWQYTFGV